jgi:peptidoglycan L-alanyl-D-glutamate endopeptidase CwlK
LRFRNLLGSVAAVLAALVLMAPSVAQAAPNQSAASAAEQAAVLQAYGVSASALGSVVIDSNLTYRQAIGDDVVPALYRNLHDQMKPYLRLVAVAYHGYDGRIHLGQLVVHRDLVRDMQAVFCGMFRLGFPIKSVIPESQFGYDDERSMLANNTSGYRPGPRIGSHYDDHFKAIAVDVNPFTNPFVVTDDNGVTTVDPPGAHYDPAAQGALYKTSAVRLLWHTTGRGYGWGGNWGDPQADPPEEFYKVGYFDWQHFYPADAWYDSIPVPPGM